MKPKGYLAMLLIAAIGIAAMALYAPLKQPPTELKLETWELPFANLQIELHDLERTITTRLKQLDDDGAGYREDLDNAAKRIDQLEQELSTLGPPAVGHDATPDGSGPQPVWLSFADAQETGKPILVHVGAKWCGPCQIFHSHFQRKAVIQQLERFACVEIDADSVTPSGQRALDEWARGTVPYEVLYVGNERVWEGVPPNDLNSYLKHLEDLP